MAEVVDTRLSVDMRRVGDEDILGTGDVSGCRKALLKFKRPCQALLKSKDHCLLSIVNPIRVDEVGSGDLVIERPQIL